jgi:tetratricopeptide (TPR) repeat protein
MIVDTIIKIDPSVRAVLARASLLIAQNKTSEAIKTYEEALKMSSNAEEKSDIELAIAEAHFRARNYRAAHNAGLKVTGKNSGKGYEIAAKSVNALMNDCGASTFDRKANNYYAVELAEKSGNAQLVAIYKKAAPDSNDLFRESKEAGEEVTLECWGKTFKIVLY